METQNLFHDNKVKQIPRIISIEGNIGVGKTTIRLLLLRSFSKSYFDTKNKFLTFERDSSFISLLCGR